MSMVGEQQATGNVNVNGTTPKPSTNGRPPAWPSTAEQFAAQYEGMFEPGQVVELRVIGVQQRYGQDVNYSGYYDAEHRRQMFDDAFRLTKFAKGAYTTINPVVPEIINRRANRIDKAGKGEGTSDSNIVKRTRLFFDIDPCKPDKHISATEEEKRKAHETARAVRDWLTARGCPPPIYMDSGNGAYLIYRIDEPTDDDGLIANCLKAVAEEFNGQADIDITVANPSRIAKLPGTLARKGDSTKDRPHRRAAVLELPDPFTVVPHELLVVLAAQASKEEPAKTATSKSTKGAAFGVHHLKIKEFLATRGIKILHEKPADDGTIFVIDNCPIDKAHGGYGEVCVGQRKSGAPWFKCQHASCADKKWAAFRDAVGKPNPDEYDPPLTLKKELIQHWLAKQKQTSKNPQRAAKIKEEGECPHTDGGLRNWFAEEIDIGNNKTQTVQRGFSVPTIFRSLQKTTNGWPKGANSLLFAQSDQPEPVPIWMKSPAELFAWIGGKLPGGKQNRIDWTAGPDKVSQAQFDAYTRQNCEQFDAVEMIPSHPPMARHYYIHPPLKEGDGSAFRQFVNRFSPATDIDHDLIEAAFMTPFAGIEPGQRPGFLIQSTDDDRQCWRGTGKTTLAELIGRLCGGHVELRADDEWDRIVTRLLSPPALTKRVAILDNVKSLRFSWADLEGGITANVISGRQLYVGEGRRPNTLTYFITLNGASLSKDMAQRVVPIVLKRPVYSGVWEAETIALLESRRWDIIADIITRLKTPVAPLTRYSRWSLWEDAVLSRVAEPSDCQRVIEERQAAVDDDQNDQDFLRQGFRDELKSRGNDPDTEIVFIPSGDAAAIANKIEGEEKRPYNRAMMHLFTLGIPEIRKSARGGKRGCAWVGPAATPNTMMTLMKGVAWFPC